MKWTKPEAILLVILIAFPLAAILGVKLLNASLTITDVFLLHLPLLVFVIVGCLRSAARTKRALRSLAAELGRNPLVSVSLVSGSASVRFDRDGTTFEGEAFVSKYGTQYSVRFDVPLPGEKLVIQSKYFWDAVIGELPADCQRVATHPRLENLHLLSRNPALLSSLLANEDLVLDLAQYGFRRCGIIRVALSDGQVEVRWRAGFPGHAAGFGQIFWTSLALHDGLVAAAGGAFRGTGGTPRPGGSVAPLMAAAEGVRR